MRSTCQLLHTSPTSTSVLFPLLPKRQPYWLSLSLWNSQSSSSQSLCLLPIPLAHLISWKGFCFLSLQASPNCGHWCSPFGETLAILVILGQAPWKQWLLGTGTEFSEGVTSEGEDGGRRAEMWTQHITFSLVLRGDLEQELYPLN